MIKISIVVNNYNYGRFLRECIESALNQTIPAHEVIIVDDGSTDNSKVVLEEFDSQIKTIYQENAGQASAMNTGFSASRGEWVWFLDADDWLMTNAIQSIQEFLSMDYSKIQGRLTVVDDRKNLLGFVPKHASSPFESSPAVNLRVEGQLPRIPPTSGNIYSREFLNSILPIPEKTYRICADEYLNYAGLNDQYIYHTPKALGYYRSHGNNAYLINTLFYTDTQEISVHLDSVIRQRELLRKQYPEMHSDDNEFPYSLNHLKTLILADRFLPNVREKIELDRNALKSQIRLRIRGMHATTKLKEIFASLILVYAPGSVINFIGFLEIRGRSVLGKFFLRSARSRPTYTG